MAVKANRIRTAVSPAQCGAGVNEWGQAVGKRDLVHGLSTRSARGHSRRVHTESGQEFSPGRARMSRKGHLPGDGPHEGGELACDRHDHDIGMLPLGHEPAVALAKAHLGLPGDVTDRLGRVSWRCCISRLTLAL